ncbi:hypothetical protein JTY60_00050 [symbiont of Argiope bruennichi]|uniref:hypothetical protein n=1 Tax=symbiont of Argiope bruennichi TaxID=2810479 RepID=UPI003DA38097
MYIYKIPNAKRKKIFYFFSLPILFFSAGCSTSENSKNQEIPLASVTSATNMNDYKNVSLPIVNDFSILSYDHPKKRVRVSSSTDWQILAHDFNLKNILSANSLFSFNISVNLKFWYLKFNVYKTNYFSKSMFSGKIKDFLCDGKVREFDWNFCVFLTIPDPFASENITGNVILNFLVIDNSIMLQILVSYWSEYDLLNPTYFWGTSKVNISDTFDNKNLVNFFN